MLFLLIFICNGYQGTSAETSAIAYAVGLKQGKIPIVVKVRSREMTGLYINVGCVGWM